jgi:hypothetical protein
MDLQKEKSKKLAADPEQNKVNDSVVKELKETTSWP